MENLEKKSPETNWLNEKQVSAMLNIKKSTLQNWRWRGVGVTYSRFMRNVRYKESDVISYLNDHQVEVEAARTPLESQKPRPMHTALTEAKPKRLETCFSIYYQ